MLLQITTHLYRSLAIACYIFLAACGGPATSNGVVAGGVTPELLMVDGSHVAAVRDSLRRGGPQFKGALTELEADANRGLTVAPMSVMDKDVTPPSGDKHDYMSQAPYWWPDPSKPGGKPYIRKDGQRNPEIDKITDRANLQRLARTSFALALAFYFTGRQDYARHAARLVRVWFLDPATRMNPNLNFGQGIPGIATGRAAGIVETRFLPQIIDSVTLLQGSSAWTVSDGNGFKGWMGAYLKWLQESPLGHEEAKRRNNQETWYELQVVALALYTGRDDVAWVTLQRSQAAIGKEFEPDGSQPRELARTRSWDYSIFDLTAFLHLATLGTRVGVDLWNYQAPNGGSLRKGADYLIPFATGDKRWPYKQITPFRASELHPVLRLAAVGWKNPKYRAIAQQIGGATPILELTFP
ncbi:MAG TPA: alginate lyase family protein [Terriglobia bacterium]|nr:alginate lyase family protein [Terriglobia bacterium]